MSYKAIREASTIRTRLLPHRRRKTPGRPRSRFSQRGLTLVELLIAALISIIVAGAGFKFFAHFHGAGEAQTSISDLQNLGRNSLLEIRKTLRMAGYKLSGHVPYRISGDTLAVYYSMTQPVDSVRYFTQEFNGTEYAAVPARPTTMKIYKLMKQVNGEAPMVYADFISGINLLPVDYRNIAVTVTAQADRADDKYVPNAGFRTFTIGERVLLRNVKS